ncbi:MAG: MotA/TolQ/ExbB proton channel family protein [Verrucomicrobiales bacterium]|nr:MotA/TolQ/ExbB proton channel family protein [Verrucomicrobiales bacterium]
MKSHILFLASLSCILLLVSLGQVFAQDDFDISIPGEEVEVNVPAPAPAGAAEGGEAPAGTAATGEVDLLDMIRAGGWSMWVLGSFSFAVIGLLIFCLIDLNKKNFHPDPLFQALAADMENLDFQGALQKTQSTPSCLSAVMSSGVHYIAERGYGVIDSEKLEETMAAASRKFNRGRVRTINYFSIIAQAAPMMGLLGTVSGMIGAFAKLSQGGTGDPSAFAGNISEALITTASGLVVALPAIFCYFIFRDRLQGLVAETDEHAEELIGLLRRTVVNSQEHEG